MKLLASWALHCGEEQVESERNPILPNPHKMWIEKSGALYCVRSSNPQDKNFGCFASLQEAQNRMHPIPRNLDAGGPGSGCTGPNCGRPSGDIEYEQNKGPITPFMRLTLNDHSFPYLFQNDNTSWGWDAAHKNLTIEVHEDTTGGLRHKEVYEVPAESIKEWKHASDAMGGGMNAAGLKRFKAGGPGSGRRKEGWLQRYTEEQTSKDIPKSGNVWKSVPGVEAVSQYGQTGWTYGQRTMGRETGYIPRRTESGFPAANRGGNRPNPSVGKSTSHRMIGPNRSVRIGPRPTGFGVKQHMHPPKIVKPANFGKVPKISMPKPHMPKLSGPMGHKPKMSPMGRAPQLQGFADWGEPMAGGMSHAHIEPITWFRPPSLTKREKDNSARIPTDDPRETNDRFLDVTKRNSKDTIEQKYKMLKRSAPGGLPAAIPARTTAIEPHQAFYMPLSQIFSSSTKTPKKVLKGSNFTSYKRRGCI